MWIWGIAIKPQKRGPMEEVASVMVTAQDGIEGDCRGRGGTSRKRQVTVLSLFQWEQACAELGKALPWTLRRANVLVKGISNPELRFGPDNVGRKLYLASGLVLQVTGETDPCSRMDEAYPGLKDALSKDWRGGVTCRVEEEGRLQCGSVAEFFPWHVPMGVHI